VTRLDLLSLRHRIGEEVAVSDWIEVTQERIDRFAGATEDRYWIHVDPGRAAVESPFRATIAHGFLTLSLLSRMARSALILDARIVLNYGLNRVRFVAPVPAGSRLRGRFTPLEVNDTKDGVQVTWRVTIERDGGDKPCCIAEWLLRYYSDQRNG
jgi:acyl dehydratase